MRGTWKGTTIRKEELGCHYQSVALDRDTEILIVCTRFCHDLRHPASICEVRCPDCTEALAKKVVSGAATAARDRNHQPKLGPFVSMLDVDYIVRCDGFELEQGS